MENHFIFLEKQFSSRKPASAAAAAAASTAKGWERKTVFVLRKNFIFVRTSMVRPGQVIKSYEWHEFPTNENLKMNHLHT